VTASCKHGNESGFYKDGEGMGELFAFLSEHKLIKGRVLWGVSLKYGVRS